MKDDLTLWKDHVAGERGALDELHVRHNDWLVKKLSSRFWLYGMNRWEHEESEAIEKRDGEGNEKSKKQNSKKKKRSKPKKPEHDEPREIVAGLWNDLCDLEFAAKVEIKKTVRGYLFTAAKNRAKNLFKHRDVVAKSRPKIAWTKATGEAPWKSAGVIAFAFCDLDSLVRSCEVRNAVFQLSESEPEQFRAIDALYYVGLSLREAAKRYQSTVSKLRTAKEKAIETLKAKLAHLKPEEIAAALEGQIRHTRGQVRFDRRNDSISFAMSLAL